MSDIVDPFAAKKEPIVSEAAKRGWSREQAIEQGARLGADTADQRGEMGEVRKERIERAKSYAAWDYDGRPSRVGDPEFVPPMETDVPEVVLGAALPHKMDHSRPPKAPPPPARPGFNPDPKGKK